VALLTAVAFLCWPGLATAASAPANAKTAKSEKDKEEELPKPEDLTLQTSDDLELTLTYYRGTKGKQTIPVVLLHMWKQSRNDYKDLAPALQAQGYAVIVPDLRGHGESRHLKGVRGDENLKAATMPPAQFKAMVTCDMEAVKKFLWERNNAGELNIDKLCVVGAEMGASVAVNFALADARDQDSNRVLRSDYQLGRFVKALVLISPEHVFHGLPIRALSAQVIPDVAVLILVGKQDSKAQEEAKRIHGMFERYHPEPTGDNKTDRKTLFFGKLDTSLQGTKLLDPKFNVSALIADFIYRRLVKSEESRDWSWRERKVPHG
jgi:pimeloyl-ACP methyl ester carboxylesterase